MSLTPTLWFALRYIVAVILTLLLFAGLRQLQIAPLEVQCAERNGQPVPHVSRFLCVDPEGHVLILER